MTLEKFKEEFESCEKSQPYSDEFPIVLREVYDALKLMNYESSNSYLLGNQIDNIKFAYIHSEYSLLIHEDIFKSLLVDISNEDKYEIIAYCFCKNWSIDFSEILNIIPCDSPTIQRFIDNEDVTECDLLFVDEETGEVFNINLYNLNIDILPVAYERRISELN